MKNRSLVKLIAVALALLIAGLAPLPQRSVQVRIGSKKFTESVILGEMMRLLAEEAKLNVVHYREFGGTRIVFDALVAGEIDVYPEYTGTITAEIFAGQNVQRRKDDARLAAQKGNRHVQVAGLQQHVCPSPDAQAGRAVGNLENFGSQTIARAAARPDPRIPRPGRWLAGAETSLRSATNATSSAWTMTSPIANCLAGEIDIIDVYSTDAMIRRGDLGVAQGRPGVLSPL